MEHTIEIPADARTVTLELKKRDTFTLRSLLPQIKEEVELVVNDEFEHDEFGHDTDQYRLRAASGNSLLHKLERSRVVEGASLLCLTPNVMFVNPVPTLLNGTLANLSGTGYIQLVVEPPAPDEEF